MSVSKKFLRDTITNQIKYYFPEVTEVAFSDNNIEIFLSNRNTSNTEKIINEVKNIKDKLAVVEKFGFQKIVYRSSETLDKQMFITSDSFLIAAENLIEYLRKEGDKKNSKYVSEDISAVQKGINVYTNKSSIFMDGLNIFFKEYFELEFNSQDVKIPSMISTDIIDKAGYFETANQHLSFVSPINNNPELFKKFLPAWKEIKEKENHQQLHQFLKEPRDILNPALCLHCYPFFQNLEVNQDELISLTVYGNVFRDESGNLNNNERLREFSMREGVFLGNEKSLKDVHIKLIDFCISFGELLGITFTIENANDMFFNENADKQLFSQLISDNKLEMVFLDPQSNKSFSIASINKHQTHFSSRFNLTNLDKEILSTMCIGFGFNRIIYALEEKLQEDFSTFISSLEERLYLLKTKTEDGVLS